MRTLQQIKAELAELLFEITQETIEFQRTAQPEHGDFACNIALKLASFHKTNPREMAADIVERLKLPEEIGKVEVAGPGFINFTLSQNYLLEALKNPSKLTDCKTEQGKIVVDYSQPNIAKPLGVHHLLSTIIGQSVVNIMKAKGNETISVNYLGDYGTQFGKVICALKNWSSMEEVMAAENPVHKLLELYVRFHEEEENDKKLATAGQEEFKKLEEGDEENRKLWHWIVELSINEIKRVYSEIGGISFDSYNGEAAEEENLPGLLEEGKKLNIFTLGEGGSYIVDLKEEGYETPYLVQKSDGATLYSTRDISAVKSRIEKYNPDRCIYVVDMAQKLHFEQLFATVPKFPWFNSNLELTHLKFGRMRFADKKMSTRKGNILYLEDVVEEAVSKAKEIIEEKNPDLKNKDQVAKIVGTGSIKYGILSQAPETDIVFSWEKTLSFEGNSAPYLQYSYARAASILRQAEIPNDFEFRDLVKEENLLIRDLLRFPEVVTEAAEKLKPNVIATYLYELAQLFSSFYTHCPVLSADEDDKEIRLKLIQAYSMVIKEGLHLLGGIEVPEQM